MLQRYVFSRDLEVRSILEKRYPHLRAPWFRKIFGCKHSILRKELKPLKLVCVQCNKDVTTERDVLKASTDTAKEATL